MDLHMDAALPVRTRSESTLAITGYGYPCEGTSGGEGDEGVDVNPSVRGGERRTSAEHDYEKQMDFLYQTSIHHFALVQSAADFRATQIQQY
jgi:hypothetical protein